MPKCKECGHNNAPGNVKCYKCEIYLPMFLGGWASNVFTAMISLYTPFVGICMAIVFLSGARAIAKTGSRPPDHVRRFRLTGLVALVASLAAFGITGIVYLVQQFRSH
jgi:hypothetical protein